MDGDLSIGIRRRFMSSNVNVDAAAVAKAVQAEIERQQSDVVYNDLSVTELEDVIQHLSSRLELCKEALTRKEGGSASGSAPAAPALKAAKVEGSWPDLPWTDRELPPPTLSLLRPPRAR